MIMRKRFLTALLTLSVPVCGLFGQEDSGTTNSEIPTVPDEYIIEGDIANAIEVGVIEATTEEDTSVQEPEIVTDTIEIEVMTEEVTDEVEIKMESEPAIKMAPGPAAVEAELPEKPSMVVEDVVLEEPVAEKVITEDGDVLSEQPELDIPSLEIDFPESGDMKLEFPTDVETEADLSMTDDETISVDFPDEEIKTIIRNVAELYELNVVIPDTLVGNTSIKLRNVTWRQVFEVVLEPINFTYIEDRNIIKIRDQADLLQEPVETRVFIINYAVAGQLLGSLAPLIDAGAGGRIQVDARTNALLITERPSRMNSVQEIIERLDRPNAQVMIESKFVEVTDRNQKNLGINWSSLSSYQVTAGPFDRNFARNRGGDTTSGTTSAATDNQGTDFDNTNGTTTNTQTTSDTLDIARDLAQTFTGATTRVDTAVFSAQAFNVVLSALQTFSDTRLVSNPTVVTLDGEKALISIGEKFPIPSYAYNDEQGSFEVQGFDFEDIGINLEVLPYVNNAGFIRLDIKPEVSSRAGEVNFGGDGAATIPIIASRRTESNVIVKDGYTLAIGGLMETQVNNTENKVPILGDIPYLGRLFKSESDDETQRNLIIFVTAKTLNPDGTSYREIIDPRTFHRMGLTEKDIPGYKLSEEELKSLSTIEELRLKATELEQQLKYQSKIDAVRAAQAEAALQREEAAAKAAAE